MPEVGKEIIKHIVFPEYPAEDPGWVDVVCNPPRETFLDNDKDAKDGDAVIIAKVLRKWNFTEKGEVLPITPENVSRALSLIDRVYIMKEIGLTGLISEVKKNS